MHESSETEIFRQWWPIENRKDEHANNYLCKSISRQTRREKQKKIEGCRFVQAEINCLSLLTRNFIESRPAWMTVKKF